MRSRTGIPKLNLGERTRSRALAVLMLRGPTESRIIASVLGCSEQYATKIMRGLQRAGRVRRSTIERRAGIASVWRLA